ncbi:RES domain protein [Leptothrix cholodnii SP-6]|uniref:RES domain protein n=1 Tax=Leptothrix cholodnii (strain ATCC 51168 / LMG 8142 / SP-6) TaxID=395495 RepID=B1Y0A5_LEPCP|nr:RES family NAD+ phosphorylase [Leptothrix cholodnii]ACB36584.1 RES domain protein [Leptothrix cholodnii SP-6]
MHPDDREALAEKRICCNCVREGFLSHLVSHDGTVALCDYCGDDEAKTRPIGDLADWIETAFEDHFVRTPTEPDPWEYALYADRELGRAWYREGQETAEAIEEAAQIPTDAAHDVQVLLEDRHDDVEAGQMGDETEFASDAHYAGKGADAAEWHREWWSFENALKTEARYFSRAAAELLTRVFENIDTLRAKQRRRPPVVNVGPNRKLINLYRARVFQSEDKLKEALCRPDLHIGPPPTRLASAGRMNARGISVFYGATNASVALAEVRPPVGSKVALAKFSIIRSLRLLDLTALDNLRDGGSIFDPTLKGRLERVAFLQSLGERMTRPVMPDDEAFEYLTTQAIADFLATENKPRLDGIIFHSAQSKGGRNVVLFHKAAQVEEMTFPHGTEIEAYTGYGTEDGMETDYGVSEAVPNEAPSLTNEVVADLTRHFMHPGPAYCVDSDFRAATLRVDPSSVEVHHVDWVKINTIRFTVSRRRHE